MCVGFVSTSSQENLNDMHLYIQIHVYVKRHWFKNK